MTLSFKELLMLRGLIDVEGERLHKKRADVDTLVVLSDKVRHALRRCARPAITKVAVRS